MLLSTLNNAGSKTLFKPVVINLEKAVLFLAVCGKFTKDVLLYNSSVLKMTFCTLLCDTVVFQ